MKKLSLFISIALLASPGLMIAVKNEKKETTPKKSQSTYSPGDIRNITDHKSTSYPPLPSTPKHKESSSTKPTTISPKRVKSDPQSTKKDEQTKGNQELQDDSAKKIGQITDNQQEPLQVKNTTPTTSQSLNPAVSDNTKPSPTEEFCNLTEENTQKKEDLPTEDGSLQVVESVPKVTTNVKFSKKRASFTPNKEIYPKQSVIGIGYQNVIDTISNLADQKLSSKEIDDKTTEVSKALRDIYYYLNAELKRKNWIPAKKYLTQAIQLARKAHEHNLILDDKKANVCAWVQRYLDGIAANQKEIIEDHSKLQHIKADELFEVTNLAIELGLQDDHKVAVDDLECLNIAIDSNNRSHFTQTVSDLLEYLSTRALNAKDLDETAEFIESFELSLQAAHHRKIHITQDQLLETNDIIVKKKKQNSEHVAQLIKHGLQLNAQMTKAQQAIYSTANQLYSTEITNQLEKLDSCDYTTDDKETLYRFLQYESEKQKDGTIG